MTLAALSAGLLVLGTGIGSAGFEGMLAPLLDPAADPAQAAMARQIVWEIRLPRTLGAWLAGALLGLAGALAQGLFRNPLADPYLLGSAAGASLGVALALAAMGGAAGMLGGSMRSAATVGLSSSDIWVRLGFTGAAFAGAVLAVVLTLALARGVQHTLRLLLAGVIVGVVLGALSSLVLLFSPDSLQAMQAFMLGSTGFVGWSACALMAGAWLLTASAAWLLARALDGLALGEATARSLGLALGPLRAALVAALALATGTAVAQTGLIAFVGLAAPHLVRAAFSLPHRRLVLLASLMGGVLLTAADLLARALIAPQELPVGILTAVLGGGYLLWLMHRRGGHLGTGGLH
ncbi:FecCD family ABC transporter permease [Ramlibacter tataouinensis]|nr:iron ABC transporter permease [Ramlibacter tataouinensis]